MIINKTYSKRPYITPACRVGEMNVWLLISSGEVSGSGFGKGDGETGSPENPPGVKSRGFYGTGNNLYHGYGEEW